MSAYLFACLPIRLPTCLTTNLHAGLSTCQCVFSFAYLFFFARLFVRCFHAFWSFLHLLIFLTFQNPTFPYSLLPSCFRLYHSWFLYLYLHSLVVYWCYHACFSLVLLLLLPIHNRLCLIHFSMTAFVSWLCIQCFAFLSSPVISRFYSVDCALIGANLYFLLWFRCYPCTGVYVVLVSFFLFTAGSVLPWLSICIPSFHSFTYSLFPAFVFFFFRVQLLPHLSLSPTDCHGTLFPEFLLPVLSLVVQLNYLSDTFFLPSFASVWHMGFKFNGSVFSLF